MRAQGRQQEGNRIPGGRTVLLRTRKLRPGEGGESFKGLANGQGQPPG